MKNHLIISVLELTTCTKLSIDELDILVRNNGFPPPSRFDLGFGYQFLGWKPKTLLSWTETERRPVWALLFNNWEDIASK